MTKALPLKRSRRVASALRLYARQNMDWSRWADTPRRMTHTSANEFLLAVLFDQGVKFERAFEAGRIVAQAFGNKHHPEQLWGRICKCDPKRFRRFMRYGYGGGSLHRYWKKFSEWLPAAARIIVDNYDGDPRELWARQRNVEKVRKRLLELPSIGDALANMTVMILARDYGLLGGRKAAKQLSVKPDVHVNRVFRRAGLVPLHAGTAEVVEAAKRLAPDFPASLDPGAWEIGKEWCRPQRPKCSECPLRAVCPKMGVR